MVGLMPTVLLVGIVLLARDLPANFRAAGITWPDRSRLRFRG
jgi:hypothetical protein